MELGYNVAIVALLGFGLRKMGRVFGVDGAKSNAESIVVNLGVMLGLEYYF